MKTCIKSELRAMDASGLKQELDTYLFIFYENESDIDPASVNDILKEIKEECLVNNDYDKLEIVINYINILSSILGQGMEEELLYSNIDEIIEESNNTIDRGDKNIDKPTLLRKIINKIKR